jgi:hypothetical protein
MGPLGLADQSQKEDHNGCKTRASQYHFESLNSPFRVSHIEIRRPILRRRLQTEDGWSRGALKDSIGVIKRSGEHSVRFARIGDG